MSVSQFAPNISYCNLSFHSTKQLRSLEGGDATQSRDYLLVSSPRDILQVYTYIDVTSGQQCCVLFVVPTRSHLLTSFSLATLQGEYGPP